ncbi:hypothetical protein [Streptomyces sp. NPDC053726]|uniref:hypothetical protein n=1 Tax=Streptomyces sp. NPDC053726 TaxID=3365713 RepID=UPI0037CE846B
MDKKGAKLLFQIFTEWEVCKATVVATDSPFAEWDDTFGDPTRCASSRTASPSAARSSRRERSPTGSGPPMPNGARAGRCHAPAGQSRLERGVRNSTRSRTEVPIGPPKFEWRSSLAWFATRSRSCSWRRSSAASALSGAGRGPPP